MVLYSLVLWYLELGTMVSSCVVLGTEVVLVLFCKKVLDIGNSASLLVLGTIHLLPSREI